MANNVARLGVVLGLDSAEFSKGLEAAGQKLEKFGEAVEQYGKMALAAMAAAGVSALSFADELNDVAKANDTTVESVLKLQKALETNGGEAENAGKIYSSFAKYIDDAAQGSMDAQKRLASMGVTLKDISTLGTQDLFNKAIVGSANTADTITRNANAYSVFGKAVKGVDLKGLAEDLHTANPMLKEQGENIVKAAEAWDELKKNTLETQTTIAGAIGPSISALIELIKELKGEGNLLGETFRITFETIAVLAANVATQFIDIGVSLQQTMLMFKAFVPGTEVEGKWSEFEKNREKNLARYEEFSKKVLGDQNFWTGEKTPKYFEPHMGVKVPSQDDGTGRPIIDAYAKQTAQLTAKFQLASKLYDIEVKQNALHLQSINGDKTAISLKTIDLQLQQQLATIANSRAQALTDEKLNHQQRGLINADFNLQESKANAKAASDKKYILELNKNILNVYAEQGKTREYMLVIDGQIAAQQIASINSDKLQSDLQTNRLNLAKELLRINQQEREDLLKAGMSQIDRNNISVKAQDDRTKAIQLFKQTNQSVTVQYNEQVDAIQRIAKFQDESFSFDLKSQMLDAEKYHMRSDEITIAQEQLALEKKIFDLKNQQLEITRTMGNGAEAQARISAINDEIERETVLTKGRQQAAVEEYQRQQSFIQGWASAYKSYYENAINAASIGAESFNSVIGSMNSALDTFVDTGKFSFEDFTKSIIRNLIKIQLHAQAMQLFNSAGNSIFGGALGSIFGSSSGVGNAYGGGVAGAVGSSARASGGTVSGNTPYLIGERGPELFVPSASGTVIPTNNLASAMGGGGQTINYNGPYIANMSAIDTQTGVQFLAKNKQTIWASYQSANRSVPVSR